MTARRAERRRDDHPAPPPPQPQRAVRRRHPPAPLLPAGAQARTSTALALVAAATSGNAKFFLGTNSAPHAVDTKEAACGCAGVFNAPFALESYAAAFDAAGALDRLEGFASRHGPAFYRLPVNAATVTLTRAPDPRARPASATSSRSTPARRWRGGSPPDARPRYAVSPASAACASAWMPRDGRVRRSFRHRPW